MVAVAKRESDKTVPVTHMRLLKKQVELADTLVPLESHSLGLNLTQRDLLQRAIQIGLDALAEKHGVEAGKKKR